MAFEGLTQRLQNALGKLRGKGTLSEEDVKLVMREVRMALLEADVNYKVVKDFIKKTTERCVGQNALQGVNVSDQVLKIVYEELTQLMGGTNARLIYSSSPISVFMLCGLQGAGKTTMAAKLANYLKKDGKRPLLVGCDIYRPAAIKQLQVVAGQVAVPVFEKGTQNPVITAQEAVEYARSHQHDVVILTKLDGDTRGGAALSVKAVTGKPIKFAGTGEKLGDIELFHPERMASRILGMGDIATLAERVAVIAEPEKDKDMLRRLQTSDFGLDDFLEQMQRVKKMGPLSGILKMLPGMSAMQGIDDLEIPEDALNKPEAIIRSMTPSERRYPEILNASRRRRIAAGSGTTVQDVNQLIKQFEASKKQIKTLLNQARGRKKFGFPGRR